jgi:hypothetical protein
MKNRIIVGLLVACIGVWIYLALTKQPAPAPVVIETPPPAPPTPAVPPAPVALAEVVEVIDIDPLLDPPARPVTGAPFDIEPEAVPVSTAPARIPPAVD